MTGVDPSGRPRYYNDMNHIAIIPGPTTSYRMIGVSDEKLSVRFGRRECMTGA